MKNNKTKTIILIFKIIDNYLDQLVNFKLSDEKERKILYKYNCSYSILDDLFRKYLGETSNKRLVKENDVEYNYLEILKNLTNFQQTLFSEFEYNSYKYRQYMVDKLARKRKFTNC